MPPNGVLSDQQIARIRAAAELVREAEARTKQLADLKDEQILLTAARISRPVAGMATEAAKPFKQLAATLSAAASRKLADIRAQCDPKLSPMLDSAIHGSFVAAIRTVAYFVAQGSQEADEARTAQNALRIALEVIDSQVRVAESGLEIVNRGTASAEGKAAFMNQKRELERSVSALRRLNKAVASKHWWSGLFSASTADLQSEPSAPKLGELTVEQEMRIYAFYMEESDRVLASRLSPAQVREMGATTGPSTIGDALGSVESATKERTRNRFGITDATLQSIVQEGTAKEWPFVGGVVARDRDA